MMWQTRFNAIIKDIRHQTTGAIDVSQFIEQATAEVAVDPALRQAYVARVTSQATGDTASESAVELLATLQDIDVALVG